MRLLLVGGGHTHLLAMPRLHRERPDWRIALLSATPKLLYSGMMPGWIAGQYALEDCTIDLMRRCRETGIDWIEGEAIDVDFGARQVRDAAGRRHPFDALSLNVGAAADPGAASVPDEGGLTVLGAKPFARFTALWPRWLDSARARPGARRLVVVGGGAAAIEIAFALARRVRNEAALAGSSVSLAMDEAVPLAGLSWLGGRLAESSLRRAGVALLPGHAWIGQDRHTLRLEVGGRVEPFPADLAILATGATPPHWLGAAARRHGVSVAHDGAIAVDARLRSVSTPGVWACGDCAAFVDRPVPRSGVHALKQAPALVDSIVHGDAARPYRPQRRALALLNRCDGSAIAVRGQLAAAGRWAWRWKDRIDRAFVSSFASPAQGTGGSRGER